MKTKAITRAAVLAAARRKYPGHQIELREYPHALDADGRVVEKARREALRVELAELDSLVESSETTLVALLKAAQFCADVNAGEPSLSRLKESIAATELAIERRERRAEIKKDLYDGGMRSWACRWQIIRGFTHEERADTLEELYDQLTSPSRAEGE